MKARSIGREERKADRDADTPRLAKEHCDGAGVPARQNDPAVAQYGWRTAGRYSAMTDNSPLVPNTWWMALFVDPSRAEAGFSESGAGCHQIDLNVVLVFSAFHRHEARDRA